MLAAAGEGGRGGKGVGRREGMRCRGGGATSGRIGGMWTRAHAFLKFRRSGANTPAIHPKLQTPRPFYTVYLASADGPYSCSVRSRFSFRPPVPNRRRHRRHRPPSKQVAGRPFVRVFRSYAVIRFYRKKKNEILHTSTCSIYIQLLIRHHNARGVCPTDGTRPVFQCPRPRTVRISNKN